MRMTLISLHEHRKPYDDVDDSNNDSYSLSDKPDSVYASSQAV